MTASDTVSWSNRILRYTYILLFGLIPLLLTPWNYELFEFNKMIGVYAIAIIIGTAWGVKMVTNKKISLTRTPLDLPFALFIGSQLISTIFSIDQHVSWFGYYSRFNGGMWSVLSYALLYYGFISNRDAFTSQTKEITVQALSITSDKKKKGAKKSLSSVVSQTILPYIIKLLVALLTTGVLVSIYGALERFGIDKNLWVQDVQNRVFSTLGQPNWLAAYLVSIIPIAIAFFLYYANTATTTGKTKRIINMIAYAIVSLLFFKVLLFTKSRSGLLGFALSDSIFLGWYLYTQKNNRENIIESFTTKALVAIHIAILLCVFFIGTGSPIIDNSFTLSGIKSRLAHAKVAPVVTVTGPALEVGGTESGVIRKYVWIGAINAWKSTPKTILIGTGTETFAFAFYQFRPVGHNLTSEWDFLYNKAHNEYLNYLSTSGLFGTMSYIFFLIAVALWFISILKKQEHTTFESYLQAGLFAGWSSILVTNFFGFSVVIMQLFLFLFPVISFALATTNKKSFTKEFTCSSWATWIVLLTGAGLMTLVGVSWMADTDFATGYRYNRSGSFVKAAPYLIRATAKSPTEPTYHDELSQSYASLAASSFENKNATQAAELVTRAIHESDLAILQSPNNVNFYKTRTKVLYTLSIINPEYNNDAIMSLKKARALSPNDPKIYYNLAILLGRQGQADESITLLLEAKKLKPNYRDVYYALHVFYLEAKKPTDAKAILTDYLTNVDPSDKDFQDRTK